MNERKTKYFYIKRDEKVVSEIKRIAKMERRSMAAQAEILLKRGLEGYLSEVR